jgi:dihydrofolate reductase
MNVTLDGYLSGPHCELDWHFNYWSKEMGSVLCKELSKADTILLGRTTYEAMARYWPSKVADQNCSGEDYAFAEMINRFSKIVFSSTIPDIKWQNSTFISGTVKSNIRLLKKRNGKNIIVYGSGTLVHALLQLECIDELQLWLHPVLLGNGKLLFNQPVAEDLQFLDSKIFPSGVVLLSYLMGNRTLSSVCK